MPKRTRQEKILARLRRLEKEQNPAEENTNAEQKISFELPSTPKINETTAEPTSSANYSYVYKDLRKSLIFVVLAVLFQIFLSIFIL